MAYDAKKLIVFGASGVLIAALIIATVNVAPSVILPLITESVWYTEIEATFNARNPDIEKESLMVKNRMVRGVFLSVKPSVEVEEKGKVTPPTGVVNFTTIIKLLDEDDKTVWSHTSNLAGLGEKHFTITLTEEIAKPGETYTIQFTTRLRITPPAKIGVVVDLTKTFEQTFTLLDIPSRERLQNYVEKPGEKLDQGYYNWLLQTLYEQKGSYFMDEALNLASKEDAFRYIYEDITYRRDIELYNQREYFAKASETMAKKAGDCEDKSVLFASTLYWKAIDQEAKVVAGKILDKGHAWVEIGGYVYDPTNNIIALKSDYYTYVTTLYFYFTYNNFSLLTDSETSLGG